MSNIFRELIEGKVGAGRRVAHSASNYYQGSFQSLKQWKSKSGRDVVDAGGMTINVVANGLGTAGGVVGALSVAGHAAAGTATAVLIASPGAALMAGLIGVALVVKGAYSNRDAAHTALRDYVWSLVDACPPSQLQNDHFSKEGLLNAADAAAVLMADGKQQLKLLHSKLADATKRFDSFFMGLKDDHAKYVRAKRDITNPTAQEECRNAQSSAQKRWAEQTVPGGAVFNYVRRLVHTGNYLQAPHIIAMAMKEVLEPGSVTGVVQKDYFAGSSVVQDYRKQLATLSQMCNEMGL